MLTMHIYCIFLVCLFVHILGYFVLHIANRPHTRLKITARSLAYKGSAEEA